MEKKAVGPLPMNPGGEKIGWMRHHIYDADNKME